MVIDLDGVLFDGTVPTPPQPVPNPRVTLRWALGTTVTIRMTVRTGAGELVDLTAVATSLLLTVRKTIRDALPAFSTAGTVTPGAGPGRAEFTVPSSATRLLDPGRFVYDVWLTRTSGRDPIVPLSPLILEPTVTAVP